MTRPVAKFCFPSRAKAPATRRDCIRPPTSRWTRTGGFTCRIPAGPGSTSLPAGVWVDYDHVKYFQQYAAPGFKVEYLIFVTNQYGDHKVSVYGFGRKT